MDPAAALGPPKEKKKKFNGSNKIDPSIGDGFIVASPVHTRYDASLSVWTSTRQTVWPERKGEMDFRIQISRDWHCTSTLWSRKPALLMSRDSSSTRSTCFYHHLVCGAPSKRLRRSFFSLALFPPCGSRQAKKRCKDGWGTSILICSYFD